MARIVPILVGAMTAVVLGTGVSTAVVRTGHDTASPIRVTTTTTPAPGSTTSVAPSTTAPTTSAPAPTSTRPTTTVARPTTTVVAPATTTTTRPVLTRAAATQGLCQEIETSVRQVAGGSTIAGGLRLVRAVNTYGDAADPAVVAPARRMLSAGLKGDYDTSAAAAAEAATACRRDGFPIVLLPECVTAPCP